MRISSQYGELLQSLFYSNCGFMETIEQKFLLTIFVAQREEFVHSCKCLQESPDISLTPLCYSHGVRSLRHQTRSLEQSFCIFPQLRPGQHEFSSRANHFLSLLFLSRINESRLMRIVAGLCFDITLCPPYRLWMPEPIFVIFGMYIMALRLVSVAICLFLCIPLIVASQRIDRNGPEATKNSCRHHFLWCAYCIKGR
jgi:hypothetical protein